MNSNGNLHKKTLEPEAFKTKQNLQRFSQSSLSTSGFYSSHGSYNPRTHNETRWIRSLLPDHSSRCHFHRVFSISYDAWKRRERNVHICKMRSDCFPGSPRRSSRSFYDTGRVEGCSCPSIKETFSTGHRDEKRKSLYSRRVSLKTLFSLFSLLLLGPRI